MNRAEHLQWCKDRAIQYVDEGDVQNASLTSDLNKHPETERHPAVELGMLLMLSGHLSTAAQMRDFIEGCN
jgi:hypothetical protein